MLQKIIRDPIYDYISFDIPQDQWALDLLNTPEVQRLRFIHQLGVSSYTYPGASHSRLSHTLGVFHLMQMALRHLREYIEQDDKVVRKTLLGAAIVHDVGHGPFSHLFEGRLGQKHEKWTKDIINCPSLKINQILQKEGILEQVSALIEKDNFTQPHWQKSLITSQLDLDRMDYLLR
ncbi:MAG TPA: HD domain-containing protein, partial [Phycisphaerae bacterium]|nr:HD domain-containing protein [Phycisphaerae bacterium]